MNELALKCWHEGFVPTLSLVGLIGLRDALQSDSEELIQGKTTQPVPITCYSDMKCCAACAIGYCGMMEGKKTVREVEDYFANACAKANFNLGEPNACRYFLNFFDDTPRSELKTKFLPEVIKAIEARKVA